MITANLRNAKLSFKLDNPILKEQPTYSLEKNKMLNFYNYSVKV